MTTLRLSKVCVVGALTFLFALVVFGNVTDYGTNFTFVGHVMAMDTTFPFAGTRYRAITSPIVHHVAYVGIILTELLATLLCARGTLGMFRARRAPAPRFAAAASPAVLGLTLALTLWLVGLIGLGSEWFGMWMSKEWSGLDNAFRYVVMTLGGLIYLQMPEAATSSTTTRS